MNAVVTICQFHQMAQQRIAFTVIACMIHASFLQGVLNDWVQDLPDEGDRFSGPVLPKFDEFPSFVERGSFRDHGLGGQEGIGKFVCGVISRRGTGSRRGVIQPGRK